MNHTKIQSTLATFTFPQVGSSYRIERSGHVGNVPFQTEAEAKQAIEKYLAKVFAPLRNYSK